MTNARPRRHDGPLAIISVIAFAVFAVIIAGCGSGTTTVTCSEQDHPKTACKQVVQQNGAYYWIALHPVSRSNPYRGTEEDGGFWHDLTHENGGDDGGDHAPVEDPVHVGGDE